jgi:peptidylprolyl isomerase domain and WD repeat-containing protein 1
MSDEKLIREEAAAEEEQEQHEQHEELYGPEIPALITPSKAPSATSMKRGRNDYDDGFSISSVNLPNSEQYEASYMHRDMVSLCLVCPFHDYLITTSIDGNVKFWKKEWHGIEFVKHFRASLGPIVAADCSTDGNLLVCGSADKGLKVKRSNLLSSDI